MIRFILFVSLYLLSLVGFSQNNTQTFSLTATVTNAVSDKGKVHFALYDSQENFDIRKAVMNENAILQEGVSTVTFKNVKPGTYTIICFHDANSNGRMDFQDNGMPIEDYGMTNNTPSFGPPLFDDGKFEVSNKNLHFEIKF